MCHLENDGNNHLEDDVAPHVEDTLSASGIVHVAILQTAQVVLIGCVQQVLGSDVELRNLLLVYVQVGAY